MVESIALRRHSNCAAGVVKSHEHSRLIVVSTRLVGYSRKECRYRARWASLQSDRISPIAQFGFLIELKRQSSALTKSASRQSRLSRLRWTGSAASSLFEIDNFEIG